MKWTDKTNIKDILFKELKIGEGFCARKVTPRDCEIIFH